MRAQMYYLLVLLTVNLCSYYLYSPTPPHLEQPWSYNMVVVAHRRIIHDMAKISDGLGYKDYHVFKQDAMSAINHVIAVSQPTDDDVKVTSDVFDGVPVRVYRRNFQDSLKGALVFLHGGGFVQGGSEAYEGLLRRLVKDGDVTVVAVEYRLAPQYPSPSALEDCIKASRYVFVEAAILGVDPKRVGVLGDDAGGNLAVSLALSFRDISNAPKFAYVASIYPWLQALDLNSPSMQQNERYAYPDLTRHGLAMSTIHYTNSSLDHVATLTSNLHIRPVSAAHFGHYIRPSTLPLEHIADDYTAPELENVSENPDLFDTEAAILDPLNFPLMADTLWGLPPIFVATMGYSTVRDDGFWFVRRLKKDGVNVKHYHDPIGWHGVIEVIGGIVEFGAAQKLYDELLHFIQIFN